MLAVIETHPIQYHAPVYRALARRFDVPVTVIYGSDFSVHRHRDPEFAADLSWDVDLLGGYAHHFLSRVEEGESVDLASLSASGAGALLDQLSPAATLIVGYSPSFHRRAWTSAWRRRIPVLFRGETSDMRQTVRAGVSAARDMALRMAYRSCARVLYIGERARRHYRALGVPDDRLIFSPYCVDTAPFNTADEARQTSRRSARAELALRDDALVLFFSGKLSLRKGVDLIVPAVRMLPPDIRSRVVVVCAGDGAERGAIEADASREPGVPLVVLGVQTQKALSRWYHASDLLLLPSRHAETWGLVVNEALHHGLPCVVSDRVGCAPDLIGAETGVVCEADAAGALAQGIVEAMPLIGADETRRACRARVANYSVDCAAAGVAEAYRSVTAPRAVA